MMTFKIDWISGSDLMGLSECGKNGYEFIAKTRSENLGIFIIEKSTSNLILSIDLAARFVRQKLNGKQTFPVYITDVEVKEWIKNQIAARV